MSYLTVFQSAQNSTNTPLEIASQDAAAAGPPNPSIPPAQPPGFEGVDLLQLATATQSGSTVTNYSSPRLRICAAQINGGGPSAGYDCWYAQAMGGSSANPQDVFQWTRQTANTTKNITMLFPEAINLASVGQMTVGGEPVVGLATPSPSHVTTITGQSYDESGTGFGTDVIVQPGLLISGSLGTLGEGQLVLSQGYLNSGITLPGDQGKLGCLAATQKLGVCGSVGSAENWVGVIESYSQFGQSVLAERLGRYQVQSKVGATWSHGDYVCKDDSNAGYSVLSPNSGMTACPAGESVGIAVNDESGMATSHTVDLQIGPSVSSQTMYFSTTQGKGSTANPIAFPNATTLLQGYYNNGGPVIFSHIVVYVDAVDSSNLCDFGLYTGSAGNTGTLLCDLATGGNGIPLASGATETFSCTQGTVTLPGGPFWLGCTANAANAQLDGLPNGNTFLCSTAPTLGNLTTNGALNASVVLPANSFNLAGATQIRFDLF